MGGGVVMALHISGVIFAAVGLLLLTARDRELKVYGVLCLGTGVLCAVIGWWVS